MPHNKSRQLNPYRFSFTLFLCVFLLLPVACSSRSTPPSTEGSKAQVSTSSSVQSLTTSTPSAPPAIAPSDMSPKGLRRYFSIPEDVGTSLVWICPGPSPQYGQIKQSIRILIQKDTVEFMNQMCANVLALGFKDTDRSTPKDENSPRYVLESEVLGTVVLTLSRSQKILDLSFDANQAWPLPWLAEELKGAPPIPKSWIPYVFEVKYDDSGFRVVSANELFHATNLDELLQYKEGLDEKYGPLSEPFIHIEGQPSVTAQLDQNHRLVFSYSEQDFSGSIALFAD